jgi:glycine cleavage system H protein
MYYYRSLTSLKFTPTHEWISTNTPIATTTTANNNNKNKNKDKDNNGGKEGGSIGMVGITNHAQSSLGDVVFLELPKIGQSFKKDDQVHVIESVKAVSHIYAPVSGQIIDVNSNLLQTPSLINTSPMKDGWLFKIRLTQPKELDSLLTEQQYQALVTRSPPDGDSSSSSSSSTT